MPTSAVVVHKIGMRAVNAPDQPAKPGTYFSRVARYSRFPEKRRGMVIRFRWLERTEDDDHEGQAPSQSTFDVCHARWPCIQKMMQYWTPRPRLTFLRSFDTSRDRQITSRSPLTMTSISSRSSVPSPHTVPSSLLFRRRSTSDPERDSSPSSSPGPSFAVVTSLDIPSFKLSSPAKPAGGRKYTQVSSKPVSVADPMAPLSHRSG